MVRDGNGQRNRVLSAQKGNFHGSCFSPDGSNLCTINQAWGIKTELLLFSVPEKKLRKTILSREVKKEERLLVDSPVFSPDGKWLAAVTQIIPQTREDLDPHDVPSAHSLDRRGDRRDP